jgi:hypothetical protein
MPPTGTHWDLRGQEGGGGWRPRNIEQPALQAEEREKERERKMPRPKGMRGAAGLVEKKITFSNAYLNRRMKWLWSSSLSSQLSLSPRRVNDEMNSRTKQRERERASWFGLLDSRRDKKA